MYTVVYAGIKVHIDLKNLKTYTNPELKKVVTQMYTLYSAGKKKVAGNATIVACGVIPFSLERKPPLFMRHVFYVCFFALIIQNLQESFKKPGFL